MEQLINMFYKDLVETLPFKDPIFQAHLKTAGLFPGDLKEIIEFKPSSAAMTAFFLDHGINNDKNNFLSLVRVMEEFNSKPVNNLASKIQKEIEQWHNKPGGIGDSFVEVKEVKILQMYHEKLCNTLTDIDDLLACFVTERIITISEEEVIKSSSTKPGKVQKLLLNISSPLKSGCTTGFDVMLKIMKERGTLPTQDLAKEIESLLGGVDSGIKIHQGEQLREIPQAISDLGCYYRELYKTKGYNLTTSDWPPNQMKLNISVTLIHYKNGRTQEELMEIAKRHEEGAFAIDDMASSSPENRGPRLSNCKVTKCLNDIFVTDPVEGENSSPLRYVLIEGAPGIGKTMLAKEIAFLWANGKLLKEVTVLFLLFLRDPKLWEVRTVQQLIQFLTHDGALVGVDCCTQMLLLSKHFQIAFIFDGFDEYPHDKNPFILNLFQKRLFPKAVVVCTSRPVASLCLHDHADRRIEILGFTKEERENYIIKSLSISPDKKDKLIKYLKDNPIIDDLCFIPLYLAILMFLFQQGTLPETLTKLNELFVIHTIHRSLSKTCGKYTSNIVSSLTDFPEKVYKFVCKLSKLAYEGVKYQQLVFTFNELKHTYPEISDVSDAANGFGLLEVVPHYSPDGAGKTSSFSFLHFTMQEFLAALHVSTLSSHVQLWLLQSEFWNSIFQYMWMMYVGLVGINHEPFSHFIKLSFPSVLSGDSNMKILHLFQCFTEAKNIEIPNLISSHIFNGKIGFHNVSFFPHSILSVLSFLSKSNVQWKALTFNQCRVIFGKDLMNYLQSFVINSADKISTLKYVDLCNSSSCISPWVVFCAVIKHSVVTNLMLCGGTGVEESSKELKNSLQCNNTLESLTVCYIGLNDLEILTDILMRSRNSIKDLNISNRTITFEEVSENNILISTVMQNSEAGDCRALTLNVLHDNVCNSNSEMLNLSNQNLLDYEVICVAFCLQNHPIITVLDISNNHITDAGAAVIIYCLLNNSVIKELNISSNKISPSAIAEIILECSVSKLDVSCNSISNYDVGTAIKKNNTLQELKMSYCQISPFGAHCIAEGLRENSSLQKLDISVNELFDNGAIAICNCLKNNFTLRELNISFNKITNTGAKEIAKAIKASNNLCTLNISGNHMTSEGIILFLCTIQTTSALKSLFIQFNNVTSSGFLEISEYIKGANLSLEIYLTWNDVIHHGLVAIQINSHFFNVHPQSELKAANVSGETSLNWPVLFVNDTNYAVELISTCLKDNCTLTKLDLLRIKIASEEAKKIAEVLEVNKTLQKLDISLQCIDDEGAMAIGESLKNNTTLQDLSIAISNNGIVTFLRTIEKNTGLVKLDLSSIWILPSSGEIVNALTSYLCNNATLQELNLSSTRFYEFEKIAEALHINTTLQKLIISYNHCHHWGRVIGNLLQNNRTLLELDVSNCNIGKDVEEISKGLEVNNSLQSLNISHNYLQDVGINCLREGLKVNSALQKLDLTENFIVKEGSMLIGMVIIQFNTTLQQLNVSQTLLTCEAMEAIGKYLRGNSSLLDISMSRCGITSDGAKHIAEAIELNTTLKKLDISYNRLVDAGAISIANSLKCNNTIQELNLSSTAFFNTGAEQIAEAVCVNKILQKLDVSHNSIDDRGVTAISECLKKNFTLQDLNISCTRVTNLAANKFAEVLQVNTSLHTLNLFQEAFFNALTFNMIILRAVHFNRFIMNLELPNTLHAVEVREEIEYINQERTRQGVHALCTNMDVKYLINDYTKLYSVCGKLSYL